MKLSIYLLNPHGKLRFCQHVEVLLIFIPPSTFFIFLTTLISYASENYHSSLEYLYLKREMF